MDRRKISIQQLTEKSDSVQPVMDVIAHSPLQNLVKKARLLVALDDHISQHLPHQLKGLCSVINVKHNTVIIRANNAAVATRIRFISDDILASLQQSNNFKSIRKVDVKVQF